MTITTKNPVAQSIKLHRRYKCRLEVSTLSVDIDVQASADNSWFNLPTIEGGPG